MVLGFNICNLINLQLYPTIIIFLRIVTVYILKWQSFCLVIFIKVFWSKIFKDNSKSSPTKHENISNHNHLYHHQKKSLSLIFLEKIIKNKLICFWFSFSFFVFNNSEFRESEERKSVCSFLFFWQNYYTNLMILCFPFRPASKPM